MAQVHRRPPDCTARRALPHVGRSARAPIAPPTPHGLEQHMSTLQEFDLSSLSAGGRMCPLVLLTILLTPVCRYDARFAPPRRPALDGPPSPCQLARHRSTKHSASHTRCIRLGSTLTVAWSRPDSSRAALLLGSGWRLLMLSGAGAWPVRRVPWDLHHVDGPWASSSSATVYLSHSQAASENDATHVITLSSSSRTSRLWSFGSLIIRAEIRQCVV